MNKSKLNILVKTLNDTINIGDKTFITRHNKDINSQMNLRDLILFSANLIHSSSYSSTNSFFKIDTKKSFSNQAFNKKRSSYNSKFFDTLNLSLINISYKNKEVRYIGVDGSQINLDYSLHAYGFKPSKRNHYCTGKIGGLYDIFNRTPIHYELSKGYESETDILIKQLHLINKNDVLVLDRGYYSIRLIKILNEKKINYIFRMKSNNIFVKNLNDKNDMEVIVDKKSCNIEARIISYSKKSSTNVEMKYYLLTSLKNKSIKELSNDYWGRWSIETNFKKLKYDTLFDRIRTKTNDQVLIDIKMINFVNLLSSHIENMKNFDNKNNDKKVNGKNACDLTIKKLLYLLMYKRKTKIIMKSIVEIIEIILDVIVTAKCGRNFKRMRKMPAPKWYHGGVRFKKG